MQQVSLRLQMHPLRHHPLRQSIHLQMQQGRPSLPLQHRALRMTPPDWALFRLMKPLVAPSPRIGPSADSPLLQMQQVSLRLQLHPLLHHPLRQSIHLQRQHFLRPLHLRLFQIKLRPLLHHPLRQSLSLQMQQRMQQWRQHPLRQSLRLQIQHRMQQCRQHPLLQSLRLYSLDPSTQQRHPVPAIKLALLCLKLTHSHPL